jgi:hypothetical protein
VGGTEVPQGEVVVAKRTQGAKPGTGAALDVGVLKRLRQEDRTWEADFRALPKPMAQAETHYLGLVVSTEGGTVLAQTQVEGRPAAAHLAALLVAAMRRPPAGRPHRPRRLHLRGHRQWRELFPRLEELGIDVTVQRELPKVEDAYGSHLRQMREAGRAGMVRPTVKQEVVEQTFPAVAKWVRGYGHIEIGDQESFGFVVRALDYGGLVFEDDKPDTLAEAMAALEKGLAEYFEREGIE